MYCAECGKLYDPDPMKRVRCHAGRILSTEAPLEQDAWYPVSKYTVPAGRRIPPGVYYLYEKPRIKIVRGKKTW